MSERIEIQCNCNDTECTRKLSAVSETLSRFVGHKLIETEQIFFAVGEGVYLTKDEAVILNDFLNRFLNGPKKHLGNK